MKKQSKDDEIVRTTIRIPRTLWNTAKHRAIEERIPVQDLVIRALTSYVLRKGGRS